MTIAELSKWDIYLGLSITGIFTGLGSALGTWIANKGIIHKIELLSKNKDAKKQVENKWKN